MTRLQRGLGRWMRGGAMLLLAPACALAHTEDMAAGFMAGLTHPVFGLDHLLAMIAVGVVSSQLGGRHLWRIPAAFVLAMIAGGALGVDQWSLPYGEAGIAMSVVLLGGAIVFAPDRTPAAGVTAAAMLFGVFHGHAHGLEMPQAAEPAFYTLGFVVGTAALHLMGLGVGEGARRHRHLVAAVKLGGSALAACGVYFLAR